MSDTDEYDTEDDETPSPRRSLMVRLMDAAPTAPARPGLDKNGNPTKWSIDRLDPRERVYCYLAGFIAAFFAVLVYAVETENHNFHVKKGQFTPVTTLVVGLVCAVLLIGTTYMGRRALVGFVALFTFLGFSNSDFVVGLPFLLLAFWLLFRSYKVQKEITARIKAERAGATSGPATPRPTRAEAAGAPPSAGRSGGRRPPPAPRATSGTPRRHPHAPLPHPRSRRGGSAGPPSPPTDVGVLADGSDGVSRRRSRAPSGGGRGSRSGDGRGTAPWAPPRTPAAPRLRSPCR